MAQKNAQLEKLGEPPVLEDELLAGRLYTGPMFQLYNAVCRGSLREAPQFMRDDFERLCKGNSYTTTLHVLNSLVVKCSKLTVATKVYRGSAKGVLPQTFWEPNAQGVRGGIEGELVSHAALSSHAVLLISHAGGLSCSLAV